MLFIIILSILIITILIIINQPRNYHNIENFSAIQTSTRNNPIEIYDKFYSRVYDELFNSDTKNEFECMLIHKDFLSKNKDNNILDIGCGTGPHLKILSRYGHNLIGLDQSKYMLKEAKNKNNTSKISFKLGDYHNIKLFKPKTFNNIICLFFTIYYCENLNVFFKNVNVWLKSRGKLFIHVVNKNKFDPILDKSSSLIPFYDPQKYTSKRNTQTSLSFNKFKYQAEWFFKKKSTNFIENFEFPEIRRTNNHNFNMYKQKNILKIAEKYGFKLIKVYDEIIIGYKYNYILVLEKMFG